MAENGAKLKAYEIAKKMDEKCYNFFLEYIIPTGLVS